jgi:hypothetical protein
MGRFAPKKKSQATYLYAIVAKENLNSLHIAKKVCKERGESQHNGERRANRMP